jgi:hypothetical protein
MSSTDSTKLPPLETLETDSTHNPKTLNFINPALPITSTPITHPIKYSLKKVTALSSATPNWTGSKRNTQDCQALALTTPSPLYSAGPDGLIL